MKKCFVLFLLLFLQFKSEILEAVGLEAFELGLLMGTESDPTEEEETQIYCFQHLLLLENTAAKYISSLKRVGRKECNGSSFANLILSKHCYIWVFLGFLEIAP